MQSTRYLGFRQSLVALAVLAAFSPVHAQEASPPQSSVTVGIGAASGDPQDRARFGIYNGMRDDDVYGLFGFDYNNRTSLPGLWLNAYGRDLGLETREAGASARRLGTWRAFINYSEILREDPHTINTGMAGFGTTTPVINLLPAPGTGSDLNLSLKRKGVTLGFDSWILPNLQVEASFKNEDKSGSRIFGRGFACSATWVAAGSCASSTTQWALLLLPEPIDSTIRQFDGKINFTTDRLMVTVGYYGSFYTNDNGNLAPVIPGTLLNPLGQPQTLDAGLRTTLGLPMALPPDNQAHQFYIAGNYRVVPGTSVNFKYAYTHATQDRDFGAMGLFNAPPERSNLGGEINTTLAQVGLSSRPFRNFSVVGNVRYEDKKNKTPLAYYNVEGTDTFTNSNPSPEKLSAKLEGTYQFPAGFRGTVAGYYEHVDHGDFTPTAAVAGLSGLRQETKETGYRLELAKNLSETLTGSLSYNYSKREGDSPWLKPLPTVGVVEANPDPACVPPAAPAFNTCIYNRTGIFPFIFEDRRRDKLRLMSTWSPLERVTFQLVAEDGKDKYTGPTEHGLRDTRMRLLTLDAGYVLSDAWKVSAYYAYGSSTVHAGHSTGYDAALDDTTKAFGATLTGRVSERMAVGADLAWSIDDLEYRQDLDQNASATNIAFLAASGGLPDVTYRLLRLRAFGDYAIDARSSVRLDLIHERSFFNEWTWRFNDVPFFYSDNTTVYTQDHQNVTFLGVSYRYRW